MITSLHPNPYGTARYAGQRMTKEDFLHWESDDNYVYEFNSGILEPTTSMRQDENQLLLNLENAFFNTQAFRDGGRLRAEMDVWLSEAHQRRPDVAYYTDQQQRQMLTGDRAIPSFVVEFGSITDQEAVSMRKRHEYFEAGVQVVWWVFPIYQEVYVYTSPTSITGRKGDESLSAAPALPDLQLTADDLFRR